MRKLKLQVQMTIDGFIGGPKGEMDWMTYNWDEELKAYVGALTTPVDTIVLGRKLAEGFIPYWASVAADGANPEQSAGKKFTETHKVVFSKTLDGAAPAAHGWNNTVVTNEDVATQINTLKSAPGGDIIAYGGATFVSALIKEDLIDEYHLLINPGAIGSGLPIFNTLPGIRAFQLVKAAPFPCGIVVLHYRPIRD